MPSRLRLSSFQYLTYFKFRLTAKDAKVRQGKTKTIGTADGRR
jgi:hypothetical protein